MFWRSLLAVLRAVVYGWIFALIRLLRALLPRQPRDRRSERDKRAARSPCVPINDPAFVRPDPLLYSQQKLIALGLAVTWDNPDIQLFENGVAVGSNALKPATTYEVVVRIWNDSFDAPVVWMPVRLSYLDFGIGTTPNPIGSTTVDVGVKGSATQPAFAAIPWTTPARSGHYCLQALLDPIEDRDTTNNLGQENTDVGIAQSPVTFTFELRNDDRQRHHYQLEVDGYTLPGRPPCSRDKDRGERLKRHQYGHHALPADWSVQFAPASPTLPPGDQINVAVTIDPPSDWTGSQAVNVNAFHEDGLAGGVTFTVTT